MSDDIDFKRAMRGVRPLKKETVRPHAPRRTPNSELRSQIHQRALVSRDDGPRNRGETTVPNEGQSSEAGDNEIFFLRRGIQKRVLRDLKRGSRYPVTLTLDLHGYSWAQAQARLDALLDGERTPGLSCLLIIHGKGLHSAEGARLKTFTGEYLKTLPMVSAFCSAQPRHGGTGALYVLVKGSPST